MAGKSYNRYYTYVQPVDTSMSPLEIGLSILAFPFVFLFVGFYEAGKLVWAWGSGVRAGLGLGPDPAAAAVRPPVERWDGKREPAYVQYLFGPVWRDVRNTLGVAADRERKVFKKRFERLQKKYFLPPEDDAGVRGNPIIGVARVFSLGLGVAVAAVLLLLAFVAQSVMIGVLWLAGLGLIYLLRAADSALLSVRHIRITCPACGHHVPYPSYQCDGCRKTHHDVRPGRYGMIYRHCRCGKALPTLLMLGSHRLTAVCPSCDHELEKNAGSMPETVLPVFGAAGAGKSQLLAATTIAARTMFERGGGSADGADGASNQWLRQTVDPFAAGGAIAKTPPTAQHAHSLRLEHNGRCRILKMFDAAGEIFTGGRLGDLKYLEAKPTFVFVLDPLSVPKFWNALKEERRDELSEIRARSTPYAVFESTVQRMHSDLKPVMKSSRLAVVVSKSDLIDRELTAAGVGADESVGDWLAGPLEQGNLVRSMDTEFASVRYFLTNATVSRGEADPSIETFLSWVLAADGMTI